jgi:hypothetical protein
VWTEGTATPTGGNNGDFYTETDSHSIWYKKAGAWYKSLYAPQWRLNSTYSHAANYSVIPTVLTDTAVWDKTGTLTLSSSTVNFSGSTANAKVQHVFYPLGAPTISTGWQVTTMPVGGSMVLGAGGYYGYAYPTITISPAGAVDVYGLGTISGITAVNNTIIKVGSFHGGGLVLITGLSGGAVWSGATAGDATQGAWHGTYGTAVVIAALGTLTAGAVTQQVVEVGW